MADSSSSWLLEVTSSQRGTLMPVKGGGVHTITLRLLLVSLVSGTVGETFMIDKTRSAASVSASSSTKATRTVVLAGATGLVGREILKGLLADDSVKTV